MFYLSQHTMKKQSLLLCFLLSWFVGYCSGLYQKSSRRIIVDIIAPKSLNLLGITSLGLIVLGYFIVGGYNNIGSYGNVSYSDSYASTFIQFRDSFVYSHTSVRCRPSNTNINSCPSLCFDLAIGVRSTAVSISYQLSINYSCEVD